MPVDPISGGLGLVSMLSGKNANKKAQGQADQAGRFSQALEQRMVQLWDKLFSRATDAEKSGEFDPDKRIAALEKDTGRYEAQDTGNLAGSLAVAGYKPGDSEIGTRMDSVKLKYRSYLDNLRNQIRDKSWWDQQNAYASVGQAGLGQAMGSAQNRQQMALGQMQNPGGFMSNLFGMFGQGGFKMGKKGYEQGGGWGNGGYVNA